MGRNKMMALRLLLGLVILSTSSCAPHSPITGKPAVSSPSPSPFPSLSPSLPPPPPPPGPPGPEPVPTAIFFLVDSSESVRISCTPSQQALRYQLPAFLYSLTAAQADPKSGSEPLLRAQAMSTTIFVTAFSSVTEDISQTCSGGRCGQEEIANNLSRFDINAGQGNYYWQALDYAGKNLQRPEFVHKIVVLISDGTFQGMKDASSWREETVKVLDRLRQTDVQVIMLRLNCDVQAGYNDSHIDKGIVWEKIPIREVGPEDKLAPTVRGFLELVYDDKKPFAFLLPERRGWLGLAEPASIPISGEDYKITINAVALGLEHYHLVDPAGVELGTLEIGETRPGIRLPGPDSNCNNYEVYLQGGASRSFVAIYWWTTEPFHSQFSLTMDISPTVIINSQAFIISTSVSGANIHDWGNQKDTYNGCYKLQLRVLDEDGSPLYVSPVQKINDDSEIVLKHKRTRGWVWTVGIPLSRRHDLKVQFGVVKDEQTVCVEEKVISARFRPALGGAPDYERNEHYNYATLQVPLRYWEKELYPPDRYPQAQVYVLTTAAHKDITDALAKMYCCVLPREEFGATNQGFGVFPWSLDTKVPGCPFGESPLEVRPEEIVVRLPVDMLDRCGYQRVLIQWRQQLEEETQGAWPAILCSLEETEAKCEETQAWFVRQSVGARGSRWR